MTIILGVYGLTYIVNLFRMHKVDRDEQFIMAYGGLRGAVGFSLVIMLDDRVFGEKTMFVTTTLVVIIFTVFIQVSWTKD